MFVGYFKVVPLGNAYSHVQADQDPHGGDKARAKNFFTFEEPKPETCRICGRGFKNIPALNGHMRLHGGFVAKSGDSSVSKARSATRAG